MPAAKQCQRSLTSFEGNNQTKWSKPAFQAFQLRPWNKDGDVNEVVVKTTTSLGIFGPQSQIEMGRAKSVPARQKDSMLDRDDVRTAHSVANMSDGVLLKPKASLEALPTRPPLSKVKQIPGRYFPKPMPINSDRLAHFGALRRSKLPVRIRNYDRPSGNSKDLDMRNLPLESISFLDVIPKSNRQKSPGFSRLFHRMKTSHTEFPEIRSEVFAICFNQNDSSRKGGDYVSSGTVHVSNENDNNNSINNNNNVVSDNILTKQATTSSSCDPNSELRSDYYTIKRISVTSSSSKTPSRAFSVVLRGHPKRLHPKMVSELGCGFSEDYDNNNNHHHGNNISKSENGSFVGGGGCDDGATFQREVLDGERPTESTKPSESNAGGSKIKVKIDNKNSALAPIMINGFS